MEGFFKRYSNKVCYFERVHFSDKFLKLFDGIFLTVLKQNSSLFILVSFSFLKGFWQR